MRNLWPKSHATHEVLESRVRSNRIEAGIGEKPRTDGAFGKGLLEPLERIVPIAEPDIDKRHGVRGHVRPVLQFLEQLPRIGVSARHRVCMRKVRQLQHSPLGPVKAQLQLESASGVRWVCRYT